MSSEVPSSSSHRVQQGSASNAPIQMNQKPVNMFANNMSVQTGEDFSIGFGQNLSGSKVAPQLDASRNREQTMALPQKNQLAYEDLARILGLQRMNSECMSEASDFASARGSLTEVTNGTYNNYSINRFKKHTSGDAEGNKKLTNETTNERSDSRAIAPTTHLESPHRSQRSGSGVADGSQPEMIKFLCSFGGKILPRPGDGKLRYVGGETRILSIYRNLSWADLVKKTTLVCNQPHSIKYPLPGEDLDSLISVSSDEDLQNMIEEYYGLEKIEGSQRPRLFLIPLNESEKTSSFESSTIPQSSPDYQYVVALNGVLDPSPRHNVTAPYFGNEANQCGVDLDRRPSACMDSPTVSHPVDVKNAVKISYPTQHADEPKGGIKSPKSIPYSPKLVQQEDASTMNYHINGNTSCRDSDETHSDVVTAHLPPEIDSPGYIYDTRNPILVDDIPSNRQVNAGLNEQQAVNYQNIPYPAPSLDEDFNNFLLGSPVPNQRPFQSEKSLHCPDDVTGLLAGSTEFNNYHNGMLHAYSDSKLQEHGGTSMHCSLEGKGPSSPLSFAKARLSPLPVSGAPVTNQQIQEQTSNDQFYGFHNGSDSLGYSYHAELSMPGRNAYNTPCIGGLDREQRRSHQDENGNEYVTVHEPQNLTTLKNPFPRQSNTFQENIYPTPLCQPNVMTYVSSTTDSVQSSCVLPNISSTGIYWDKAPEPQKGQLERATTYQSAEFQRYNQNGMTPGAQEIEVSRGKYAEPPTIIPITNIQSHHGTSLNDLHPMLSTDEQTNLSNLKDAVLQYPLQASSTELDPFEFCGLAPPSLHPYQNNPVMPGNQSEQAVHKHETSLIDYDFSISSNQRVENMGHRKGSLKVSYPDESVPAQTTDDYGRKNYLSSTVGEVASFTQPSHLKPSSEAHIVDGISSDVCSGSVTGGDHVYLDNELENDCHGGGKDMSFNDAVIAEMEAGIYGLQIIKNADLEELRELGSGTYGTVYHGKWRGTDVAIKRLKKSCFAGRSSEEERLTKDFWREAQILSNLHHPNVLAFYGIVPDGAGGTLATVTEFMVNGSLRNVLLKKDRSLDRSRKLIIAMDAAFGMEYLHSKSIVLFDLKCDNLLVNLRDPQRPICKVGDFGLSRIKRNTLVSGGVRGTLPWMAPELLNGTSSKVSEKVDVFSFGIVMWEILTGEEPYADMHCGAIIGGIVKNTLRPPIPQRCDTEWKNLMEQCWSPDPEERPSFTEIANKLRIMLVALQPKGLPNR
ncbi:hypothetical protein QQ045_000413 [Rhodiola kirilowii]